MNIFGMYLGGRINRTWYCSDMGFLGWNKHMFEGTICSNGVFKKFFFLIFVFLRLHLQCIKFPG